MAFWTDEEIEIVRNGLKCGLSAAGIAATLEGRTRNMVISVVNRRSNLFPVGFSTSPSEHRKARMRLVRMGLEKPLKELRLKATAKPIQRISRIEMVKYELQERKWDDAPRGTGIIKLRPSGIPGMAGDFKSLELHELDRSHCRYPHGDGPFTFCGHEVEQGGSYCPHHAALCYRKVEDRAAAKVAA